VIGCVEVSVEINPCPSEAAEHAWENVCDERASAMIFVTPDIDEATERGMDSQL
jgi:hypothetical protein